MTVSPAELQAFIARVLVAVGLPVSDAERVASLMARADLTGADGHGVFRLPQYVRRIRAGGINLRPAIRVVRESTASAVLDGDNGMGHLVMQRAAELAIEKALAHGIGWVGAFRSNHAGPAALYADLAAERGLVGIYLAVGSANHMAPGAPSMRCFPPIPSRSPCRAGATEPCCSTWPPPWPLMARSSSRNSAASRCQKAG